MIKNAIRELLYIIKLKNFYCKWRRKNKHNRTKANSLFPINKVNVGKYSYGFLNVHYYKTNNESLTIGSFCSIADDVHFFTGGEHDYNSISTFPFINHIINHKKNESKSKGPIIIDDDVWIGYGSIILSGVHIGKGAVIGAGSVVAKDVPPYAIYCGNKIIKYRFSKNIIEKLLRYDFNSLDDSTIKNNIDFLYTNINENNIDDVIRRLS